MKTLKSIFVIAIAAMFVFSFTSCKKDGVYNPKQKISKIYDVYDEDGDGVNEEELYAQYIWNGNLLQKISYFGGESEVKYTYNSKKQATKIEMEDASADIEYDGSKLSKITAYQDGEKYFELAFEHNGNKIIAGKLTLENMEGFMKQLAKRGSLVQRIFNAFVPANMNETIAKHCENAKQSKGQSVTLDITYSWAGNNVSKVEISLNLFIYSVSVTGEYEYDNKLNPFYNGIILDFNDGNMDKWVSSWMDQNNMTKCVSTSSSPEGKSIVTYTYDYKYDGDYPVDVTTTVTWQSGDQAGYILKYEYEK